MFCIYSKAFLQKLSSNRNGAIEITNLQFSSCYIFVIFRNKVDVRASALSERGFCYAGPAAWNSLPHHLHQITDTGLLSVA